MPFSDSIAEILLIWLGLAGLKFLVIRASPSENSAFQTPLEGMPDAVDQGGVGGCPVESLPGSLGGCHEARRIAGSPGSDVVGDRLSDDLFHRSQNLTDAGARSRTQIAGKTLGIATELLERQAMRFNQIPDVDIVADRCAVGCRIVVAEDFQRWPFAQRGVDGERDQMRFGVVLLAQFPVGVAAGNIEIAQCGPPQTVAGAVPAQHLLDHELGLAVGADRILWGCLEDRDFFRDAIGRAR